MYSQPITHLHRTAFLIALDCSTSMQGLTKLNNRVMRKAEAVAVVCNFIIDELLERATRHSDVRNYYDISIIGYTENDITPIIPYHCDKFISISELAKYAPPTKEWCFTSDETNQQADFTLREWVKPLAKGRTPMHAALTHIYTLVERWCAQPENRDSFPPMVFNITDGEANDATPDELVSIAEHIRETGTNDGNTLLINIHLGNLNNEDMATSEIFPSDFGCHAESEYQMMLYRMSSVMPRELEPVIEAVCPDKRQPPYRAVGFNVTPGELLNILNIGSESINIA